MAESPVAHAPLVINGLKVDARLLEAQTIRRCRLEECQALCCGGGVYIRQQEMQAILARAEVFQPYLPPDRRDPRTWFYEELEPDDDHPAGGLGAHTAVVDDATHPFECTCVFLRADRKCVLQLASLDLGEHPWRFKPFYCALHPITFDRHLITLDDQNPMFILGGSCCRPDADHPVPLYKLFEAELRLALGEAGYEQLEALAASRARRLPLS